MASHPRLSIVILYSHPLLGEGIGRLLAAEPGARVTFIPAWADDPLEMAARVHPKLILLERGAALDPLELMVRFPSALVIDFTIGPGPTWVYRRQEIPGSPEAILQLVRRLQGGHPTVLFDETPHTSHTPHPVSIGSRA